MRAEITPSGESRLVKIQEDSDQAPTKSALLRMEHGAKDSIKRIIGDQTAVASSVPLEPDESTLSEAHAMKKEKVRADAVTDTVVTSNGDIKILRTHRHNDQAGESIAGADPFARKPHESKPSALDQVEEEVHQVQVEAKGFSGRKRGARQRARSRLDIHGDREKGDAASQAENHGRSLLTNRAKGRGAFIPWFKKKTPSPAPAPVTTTTITQTTITTTTITVTTITETTITETTISTTSAATTLAAKNAAAAAKTTAAPAQAEGKKSNALVFIVLAVVVIGVVGGCLCGYAAYVYRRNRNKEEEKYIAQADEHHGEEEDHEEGEGEEHGEEGEEHQGEAEEEPKP